MNKIRTWDDFFKEQGNTLYFRNLLTFIEGAYKDKVYPAQENIFNAFTLTPLSDVKVVIIGQDPYHQPGQAMGLAFSVPSGTLLPPSLKNIFKEIADDVGGQVSNDGDLTYLAKQGVFLLNTILTVKEGSPLSHANNEYAMFTESVLKELNKTKQPIVFLLWGAHARKYKKYITNNNKLVLEANHPSPLSANRGGFFGTKHFSKTNEFLSKNGVKTIDWLK